MGLAEAFAPGATNEVFDEVAEEIKHKADVFRESQKTRRREEMKAARGGVEEAASPDGEDPDVSDWFNKRGL